MPMPSKVGTTRCCGMRNFLIETVGIVLTISSATPATHTPFTYGERTIQSPHSKATNIGMITSPAPAGAGTPVNIEPHRRQLDPELGVEPRQAQRAAHRVEQHDGPADAVQLLHRPEIEHRRGRHAEADEVRQRIELGAETRGRFQQPRDPPVEPVEHRRRS